MVERSVVLNTAHETCDGCRALKFGVGFPTSNHASCTALFDPRLLSPMPISKSQSGRSAVDHRRHCVRFEADAQRHDAVAGVTMSPRARQVRDTKRQTPGTAAHEGRCYSAPLRDPPPRRSACPEHPCPRRSRNHPRHRRRRAAAATRRRFSTWPARQACRKWPPRPRSTVVAEARPACRPRHARVYWPRRSG